MFFIFVFDPTTNIFSFLSELVNLNLIKFSDENFVKSSISFLFKFSLLNKL